MLQGDGASRDRLAEVMGRLAGGDRAAIHHLIEEFGGEIAGAVRRVAAARLVRLPPHEVDELVTEVAIEVTRLAGSWDPGVGAPPWVWARRRVERLVDRHVGQHAASLDDERTVVAEAVAPPVAAGHEPGMLALLDQIAPARPGTEAFREALHQVASPRDRELYVEVLVQEALSDPSPAVTVGNMLGLHPATVRQQYRRVRLRLRALAANDIRYRSLADLPCVA